MSLRNEIVDVIARYSNCPEEAADWVLDLILAYAVDEEEKLRALCDERDMMDYSRAIASVAQKARNL
jgi:hypothetical protein